MLAETLESSAPTLPLEAGSRYRLSRHAQLRPVPEGLLAEGPAGGPGLLLSNASRLRLVLAFLQPCSPAELVSSLDQARRPAVLRFVERCRELGLLDRVEDEESGRELAHWEPHDLRFHLRSRRGRNATAVGATYHLAGSVPEEPAQKPASGPVLPLPPPASAPRADLTLAAALEARRSRYGAAPPTLDDLGELLFRSCRVTGEKEAGGERFVRKPYPSGGSLHSLEVYAVVDRCRGLDAGLYRYLAAGHGLERIAGPGPDLDLLLEEARQGTGGALQGAPPVLLVLTSRFRRVARKYQSLAYSLVLKEAGALLQTFYLVATALDLAACAIGTGDSDRFARAAGLDYFEEVSVGEMVLGRSGA